MKTHKIKKKQKPENNWPKPKNWPTQRLTPLQAGPIAPDTPGGFKSREPRATPMQIIKSAINVWTRWSEHFLPSNKSHQISVASGSGSPHIQNPTNQNQT